MTEAPIPCSEDFLRFAHAKIKQQQARILEAIAMLPDDAFWRQPNPACNSVAQLLLHLAGNTRQWILHGVGGAEDIRDRDAEFDATPNSAGDRQAVTEHFRSTLDDVLAALSTLDPSFLTKRIRPQGYQVSVLEAVFHVTEHFSYHAGQIFLLVKIHSFKDLGFYRHLDKSNKTHDQAIP
jgi:uncharacterized damage-inducible protein DinB